MEGAEGFETRHVKLDYACSHNSQQECSTGLRASSVTHILLQQQSSSTSVRVECQHDADCRS